MSVARKSLLGVAIFGLVEKAASVYVDTWTKATGYADTAVSGVVFISDYAEDTDGNVGLNIWLDLANLPSCTATNGVVGSCTMGINTGTSCSDVGGAYYKTSDDPWKTATYSAGNMTESNTFVFADLSISDITGKVFVINSTAAEFIACGIIKDYPTGDSVTTFEGTFETYPDYTGTFETTGSVTVDAYEETLDGIEGYVVVTYDAEGLDGLCVPEADFTDASANHCGVHVHSGACTSSSTVSGHYYKVPVSADPWTDVVYAITTTSGNKSALSTVPVVIGAVDLEDRSIVMHDFTGDRIGCATLSKKSGAVAGSITQTPGMLGFFAATLGLFWAF